MAENSKIEWTNHTFNPWRGCTKVSPGCANCYAESLSKRNPRLLGEWGPGKPRVLASEDMWKQPLKWNRQAELAWENWETAMPLRPRVFCASLADWLDDEVPIAWLARLMELIMRTPHLDWLLLTKRPENWKPRLLAVLATQQIQIFEEPAPKSLTTLGEIIRSWLLGNPPPNVWMGTTVEDQGRADERIPQILSIPARVRFLSCEPVLSNIEINKFLWDKGMDRFWPKKRGERIDWVICGGESGPKARPMNPDWARSLRDQCTAASVLFFFKQWGEWVRDPEITHAAMRDGMDVTSQAVNFGDGDPTNYRRVYRVGKLRSGRLLDGREWNEMPRIEGRAS